MKAKNSATFFAILAAALYAVNIPLSKVLLDFVQPTMMAAFLYLGAGIGLFFWGKVTMLLNTDWEAFGGNMKRSMRKSIPDTIPAFCGMLFSL